MSRLTRRRVVLGVAGLFAVVFLLVVWGPRFLAQGIGDGWEALCRTFGRDEKTSGVADAPAGNGAERPPGVEASSAGNSADAKLIRMTPSSPPLPGFLGAPGDPAPDFTLRDVAGVGFHLNEARGKSPVVIEFGSAT
jgi:hypothetical protein